MRNFDPLSSLRLGATVRKTEDINREEKAIRKRNLVLSANRAIESDTMTRNV